MTAICCATKKVFIQDWLEKYHSMAFDTQYHLQFSHGFDPVFTDLVFWSFPN